MDYLTLKWLHVMSSTILFGAGVGSAFHLLAATLRGHAGGIAGAARNVVVADWLLTTPTAILQPATGLWLVHLMGIPWATPWVAWSLGLYVVAIACWLPVLWIQVRLRDLAVEAERAGTPLTVAYRRLFLWWVRFGAVAFMAFLLIFWLMVRRSVPWAA